MSRENGRSYSFKVDEDGMYEVVPPGEESMTGDESGNERANRQKPGANKNARNQDRAAHPHSRPSSK